MTVVLAPRSVMYFAQVASNTPIERYSAAASARPDRTPRFATRTRSARFGCFAPTGGSSMRATAGEVNASATGEDEERRVEAEQARRAPRRSAARR